MPHLSTPSIGKNTSPHSISNVVPRKRDTREFRQ